MRVNGHLEAWLEGGTFFLNVRPGGGACELGLVPVDRSGAGPRHEHEKTVKTTVSLSSLEALHEALGEMVERARQASDEDGQLLVILTFKGHRRAELRAWEEVPA